jgi:hypothetical protein
MSFSPDWIGRASDDVDNPSQYERIEIPARLTRFRPRDTLNRTKGEGIMPKIGRIAVTLLMLLSAPGWAQDPGANEILVTGARRTSDDFDESRPAVGLRRTADFAVLQVVIAGDTRDMERRREEIFTMVRSALDLASRSGVELATGDFIVEPLTPDNYRNLPMVNDGRPDSDRVVFLVKTRLGADADGPSALQRIDRFIRAVPATGRAEIRRAGTLTLSVVAPDQYRGQILDLIAADSQAAAARFGPSYAVEARGLDRPVEWTRATLTEVFLYVPYNIVVRPAG